MGMVVRSNIMALNANRQLGMNNSQVSKNLEKLSSGYKINRAGDDASGLAISEKMKAQIKGLKTASANSQDGISLVQTAEGALTEVHDMLNRMVELAGKSANGTIDNNTDRAALQKEMNALLEEIDRIADSTDFNGIKLLNGELAGKIDATFTEDTTDTLESVGITAGSLDLSKANHTLAGDLKVKVDGGKLVITAGAKSYEGAWNGNTTGAVTLKQGGTDDKDTITVNVKDTAKLKAVTTEKKVGTLAAGKPATEGLTLQIGDTADDFNKVTVHIQNMNSESLGLKTLRDTGLMTQDAASAALNLIKNGAKSAINTVSSVRADLGAMQNRLEHTINNLDVATENMESSNSRIRDTDMAKEMMEYTKQNVLTQAAQAMLAQANQQPQSILQLLQ